MKIYTHTGDEGMTSLATGERVPKYSLRVCAYGDIDELQAAIGLARSLVSEEDAREVLLSVGKKLYSVMSELALRGVQQYVFESDVEELEQLIDKYAEYLPKKFTFSVPGESPASAALHLARTVCRRCERSVLALEEKEDVEEELMKYLNRVSDLMYVLSVYVDRDGGEKEDTEGADAGDVPAKGSTAPESIKAHDAGTPDEQRACA